MIPVSSATSRTAVSSGVSPSSMCPLGRDQRRRPRRSVRPMRAARGPVHGVVGHHQAPGGGLVDPAQPAAGASAPARPSHARRVARRSGTTLARRVPRVPRVVLAAEPVPPAVQETVRALVDLSPVLTELGAALHRGRVRGAPRRRLGARRAAGARAGGRRACPATSTSPPTPGRSRCSSCCAAGPVPRGTPASRSARSGPRCAACGWRSPPSAPTATTGSRATRRWPGATRWSTTWCAATSPSTRWRCRSGPTARSPTRSAGSATCWPSGCARPARPSTPSPTTRCGCCAPSGSSPSSGSRRSTRSSRR